MAILGYGSDVGTSTTQGSFTSVGTLLEITPPNISVTEVDITHLASTSAFREFMSGLGNGGSVVFKIQFVKANMTTLYGYIRTTRWWQVTYSDLASTASTWQCQGFISSITGAMPMDDDVTADFTIKLTGKPVYTAGT